MGSKRSGLLGGLTGGLVLGGGESAYVLAIYQASAGTAAKELGLTFSELLTQSIPGVFVSAILFGAFFGLIYGWKYERIPGRSPGLKGIAVGALLFLLNLSDAYFYASLGSVYLASYVLLDAALSIVFGLVCSYAYFRLEVYRASKSAQSLPRNNIRRW